MSAVDRTWFPLCVGLFVAVAGQGGVLGIAFLIAIAGFLLWPGRAATDESSEDDQ